MNIRNKKGSASSEPFLFANFTGFNLIYAKR